MGMDIVVPRDKPERRMISDLEILECMIPLSLIHISEPTRPY